MNRASNECLNMWLSEFLKVVSQETSLLEAHATRAFRRNLDVPCATEEGCLVHLVQDHMLLQLLLSKATCHRAAFFD
jgi:hypothetical protein